MQDGSRQLGQGIKLATHSFTEQECIFLAKILNSKYKLYCTVYYQEEKPMIYIQKRSLPLLRSIVSPYMYPSMLYTLYKTPHNVFFS